MKTALSGAHREASMTAIDKEIINIISTHDTINAIAWKDLLPETQCRTRRNFMVLVNKYKANGNHDKVKARWVYGAANTGNILDEEPSDTTPPTVNPGSTLIPLFMIAAYNMKVEVHDIPGAFHKSDMKTDAQPLFGFVGQEITTHPRRLHPELVEKNSPRGNLFFQIMSYIYGTNDLRHNVGIPDEHRIHST
jgi:hypothetical protein